MQILCTELRQIMIDQIGECLASSDDCGMSYFLE
jgi:hypothetical protein